MAILMEEKKHLPFFFFGGGQFSLFVLILNVCFIWHFVFFFSVLIMQSLVFRHVLLSRSKHLLFKNRVPESSPAIYEAGDVVFRFSKHTAEIRKSFSCS